MYTQMDEINLVSDLLYAIGINVNPTDNTLIDQETGEPILFKERNIKVTRNAMKPAYISTNDVKLEPADPRCTKLMSRLFGFYLDKTSEMGDIPNVLTYYFDDNEDGTTEIVIKYENGTTFISNAYRNKSIVYADAIFQIDGSFRYDLSKFDLDEDVNIDRR